MQRRFSGKEEKILCCEYLDGLTTQALADRYRTERITVAKTLKRNRVILRGAQGKKPTVLSENDIKSVISLYKSGFTQRSIAKKFKTHHQRISTILKSRGIRTGLKYSEGRKHPRWKGGRTKTSGGYVLVLLDVGDPMFSMATSIGYVLEHRLIMARSLGRPLTKKETVHHINGIKSDNRIENLQLRRSRHGNGVVLECRECGSRDIFKVQF